MFASRRIWVIALSPLLALTAALAHAEGTRTPKPTIVIEKQGQCVAPPEEMRRTHMDLLKHQRDKTLREGVRGAKVSLNACIECHASRKTGSVLGSNQNFCQSCHSYVAVKVDCFECHQATPASAGHSLGAASDRLSGRALSLANLLRSRNSAHSNAGAAP